MPSAPTAVAALVATSSDAALRTGHPLAGVVALAAGGVAAVQRRSMLAVLGAGGTA